MYEDTKETIEDRLNLLKQAVVSWNEISTPQTKAIEQVENAIKFLLSEGVTFTRDECLFYSANLNVIILSAYGQQQILQDPNHPLYKFLVCKSNREAWVTEVIHRLPSVMEAIRIHLTQKYTGA